MRIPTAAAFLLLVAALTPPSSVGAVSLFEKLNGTANVAKFAELLKDTGLATQMSSSGRCNSLRCFLVFAFTNAAYDRAYSSDPTTFSALDKKALVQHHYLSVFASGSKGLLNNWRMAGTPVGLDIGFGQVQILTAQSSTLYWLAKDNGDGSWSYRVNNAAIIVSESNQEADNGVFHVLNQVALPIGSNEGISTFFSNPTGTVASQLRITKSLRYFDNWMTRDTGIEYIYTALKSKASYPVRTLFLPSDSAWERIPAGEFAKLNSSHLEYRKVLLAHFAPDICVFTSWMTQSSSISFTTGINQSDAYAYDARMYLNSAHKSFISAGGVVAQFVENSINYPIGDTVIHVIDRPLAFAHETLAELAANDAPKFYNLCMEVPDCKSLLMNNDSQAMTLFAPINVDGLRGLNSTLRAKYLQLHFVPRMISKPDMTEADLVESSGTAGQLRFRMSNNGTTYHVEGRLLGRGFVRSELRMSDQPAKNGIFHKVKYVLGLPRQTVKDFLDHHPDLSHISPHMMANTFDPNLGSVSMSYTVFPPTNAAMNAFRRHKAANGAHVGEVIMRSPALRNRMFRRVVLPGQMIIADTAPTETNTYYTANTAENEMMQLTMAGAAGLNTRIFMINAVGVQANVSLAEGQ